MSKDSTNPTEELKYLEKALQENFNHARHAETLRDRYIQLYWILWATALAFIGKDGLDKKVISNNWHMFAFLFVMSIAVLINTLKLTAEFANHIAAVSAIANKLNLNKSTPEQEKADNEPLPYPEFDGYLALPLKFPKVLSVGVVLAVIQCVGLAISFGLLMASIFSKADSTFFEFGEISISHFLLWSGIGGFAFGILICKMIRDRMMKGIKTRIPRYNS